MPFAYVLEAIQSLAEIRREELHDYERPVAYLAYQHAETNRDTKKRRKPFSPDEFYFYANPEDRDLPEPKFGAAAKVLIERELFPPWALFVYKDLVARAGDALPPEVLCLTCDDVIVLAPSAEDGYVHGMMIAKRSASNQVRELQSPCGQVVTVRMPQLAGEYVAEEELQLRIIT